jgi:hypothetical protein
MMYGIYAEQIQPDGRFDARVKAGFRTRVQIEEDHRKLCRRLSVWTFSQALRRYGMRNLADDRKWPMGTSDLTPDERIAVSMEDISRYVGEIRQLLQDLAARPEVDNDQLTRIATAVS